MQVKGRFLSYSGGRSNLAHPASIKVPTEMFQKNRQGFAELPLDYILYMKKA